jgi:hypothetical protein
LLCRNENKNKRTEACISKLISRTYYTYLYEFLFGIC